MKWRHWIENIASKKKVSWKDVKSILVGREKSELMKLIADLYSYSDENRIFVHSRYAVDENRLEPYKSTISESLYPDIYSDKPIRLAAGKKAISDYFKPTKDTAGRLELMVCYFESGNRFTVDIGDIDEQFYSSLISMFERILAELSKQSEEVQDAYFPRLEEAVSAASNVGWGYYDYISQIFLEYEIDTKGV